MGLLDRIVQPQKRDRSLASTGDYGNRIVTTRVLVLSCAVPTQSLSARDANLKNSEQQTVFLGL